jgi:hypothetical protein
MLELLKEACPVICEQGFGSVNGGEDVDRHPRSQFLFTSDRDKGLKPALREVFPHHKVAVVTSIIFVSFSV